MDVVGSVGFCFAVPVASFVLSRVHAKRVFASDLSREEGIYRIRRFIILFQVPLALLLVFPVIFDVFPLPADNVLLVVLVFVVAYTISVIAAVFGAIPYYSRLKGEEVDVGGSVKNIVLVVAMAMLPVFVWLAVVVGFRVKAEYMVPLSAVFAFFVAVISPNMFTLFYRAKRLEDPMRSEILKFCEKCGVRISDVRVVSTPEKVANARLSGVVRTRLFLTDHLLDTFSRDELMAVVAHEIGHLKGRHNLVNVVFTIAFFAAWMYALISIRLSFYGFLLLILATFLVYFVLMGKIRMQMEFLADSYAARVVGNDLYIRTLSKLAEINVLQRSDGLLSILMAHPPIEDRIKRLSVKS